MSACSAAAMLKKSSSVPGSITSIMAPDEGFTQSPPMKKRSALRSGALVSLAKLIFRPPLVPPALQTAPQVQKR
jgi:hypothetical protein